jgi:potassium-transporting ATPase potassium-binding subunit
MTMTVTGWAQIPIFLAIIVAITPLLGAYMLRVFNGVLSPVLRPVEIAIHKISGIDERQEQRAAVYTVGMMLFQIGGFLILYVLMRAQA